MILVGGITFSVLIVAGGVACVFARKFRASILALWVVGLAMGGLFLMLGSEWLALLQWVSATLGLFCQIAYSLLFGEFLEEDREIHSLRGRGWILPTLSSLILMALIGIGVKGLVSDFSVPEGIDENAVSFGSAMAHDHFITVLVLGMGVLLVTIGVAIVGRADWKEERE